MTAFLYVCLCRIDDVLGSRATFFDDSRCPDSECSGRNDSVIQNDSICSHDCSCSDDGAMKDHAATRRLRPIFKNASLEVHRMADNAVISDSRVGIWRGMDDRAVLNAGALTYDYLAFVAPQDCAGPY